MNFKEFFSEIGEIFSKKSDYERAFDEMMKVRDNLIQDYIDKRGKLWN